MAYSGLMDRYRAVDRLRVPYVSQQFCALWESLLLFMQMIIV